MDKKFAEEYYHLERTHWWFNIRLRILSERIRELLINKGNLEILNIGAATGMTSEMLSAFGNVTSVEYDDDFFNLLQNELKVKAIHASIENMPFASERFDVVCAFDVIEHIENDFLAVSEMIRVAKAGGMVFITVPAFRILWSSHDEVNQHKRRYNIRALRELFRKISCEEKYSSFFNTLLFFPVLIFRLFVNMFPFIVNYNRGRSDFTVLKEKNILNNLLFRIFSAEVLLLRFIRLPFGVSIFFSVKKIATRK